MSWGKWLTVLAAFVVSVSSTAFSQDELQRKSRPAVQDDVIGTWEMIYQKHGGLVSSASLFVAPYQRIQFLADGYVKHVTSNRPLSAADLSLWKVAPKSSKYTFPKPGVLSVVRSPTDRDVIVISFITAHFERPLRPDAPILKKGDLLVSYLDPKNQLYLQRYLRRVAENP